MKNVSTLRLKQSGKIDKHYAKWYKLDEEKNYETFVSDQYTHGYYIDVLLNTRKNLL